MRALFYFFGRFSVRIDARGGIFNAGVLCIETDSAAGEICV